MLETERLLLRNWRSDDLEPFLRHTNTPAVMRWLGGVLPEDKARARLAERLMRWQQERGFTFWIVERKRDREVLGFCGLKLADDEGAPVEGDYEIGWRLREDAWGQGYAKEAACATLDFAFDHLYAPHVVALTVIGNEPSWGLMERLGMTRRPDLDYQGADWAETPVIVYRVDRQEWRDRWG